MTELTTFTTPDDARDRADMIGRVVWALVQKEAEKTSNRSIHLIAGFRPEHLAGISRMMPSDLKEKTLLKIREDIDESLGRELPEEHLTEEAAVHFRNSDAADIILFAVSDEERETVGASLNPVSRIDRNSLQQASDLWLAEILSTTTDAGKGDERRNWIEGLIQGLNRSEITKELDQFAEFLHHIGSLQGVPWAERVRLALPAVQLPVNSLGSIPPTGAPTSAIATSFRVLFRTAEREVSSYAYLIDKSDRPIEPATLLSQLDEYGPGEKEVEKKAVEAIRALAEDAKRLRPGDWHPSQERFCADVDWKLVGKEIFEVKKHRRAVDLGEKTKEFLSDEYADDMEDGDSSFLDDLRNKATTPEQDHEFFERWQEKIMASKNQKLYEAWRRHLFSVEVRESDFQVAILRGAQTLLMKTADETGTVRTGAKIVLAARQADRISTWSDLDARVYALFRKEAQLLSAILKEHVRFEFGRWLNEKAITNAKEQKTKDSRQIEFEMFLVDNAGELADSTRIRIFWQPGHTSMALAWPEDIEALYQGIKDDTIRVHSEMFAMKPGGEAGALPASLKNTESFVDVCGREEGRTASPANLDPKGDVFSRILSALDTHVSARTLEAGAAEKVQKALVAFRASFGKAITALHQAPEAVYATEQIARQTQDFGALCEVSREQLSNNSSIRTTTMREICEFGLVTSSVGQGAVIIPAWHPLRLHERQAKAVDMARFIATILDVETISSDGLERSCADREEVYSRWYFPEVVSIGLSTFAAIEHVGGYSFAIPVTSTGLDPQDLEVTARVAVREYAAVADRYLALNPHEESNFSTAIFNADTISIPSQIANELERRMARQKHLRCSLLITHDNPKKMRSIYAQQNARLRGQSVDEITEGFLSRLRVGVGKGDTDHTGRRRSSIDIVFLHDAFYRHSEVTWDFAEGIAASLDTEVDFRNAAMPRRKNSGAGDTTVAAKTIEMALSSTRPPQACAQFLDLCYATHKDPRIIRDGHRAIPIRRLSWDSDIVRRTIERAHDLGEWVVSVDSMSSRQMLADNGIKVIRDIALTDSEMRVLVSSREPSESLRRHMVADFRSAEDLRLHENAETVADEIIRSVVETCGQKILSSARSKIAAREIVGLAAARTIIEIDEAAKGATPIWFSLDDNRAFFGLKGKMADTLSLVVRRDGETDRFVIDMTIVEAKCVGSASEQSEAKSSLDQVASTLGTLRANFLNETDPVAREAWGLSLLSLLSLRPAHVRFFTNNGELEAFRHSLANGNVDYCVVGRSIVVVHDDVSPSEDISVKVARSDDDIQQYRLGQRASGKIFQFIDKPRDPDAPVIPRPDTGAGIAGTLPSPPPVSQADHSLATPIPNGHPQPATHENSVVQPPNLIPEVAEPMTEILPSHDSVTKNNPAIIPALTIALKEIALRHGGDNVKAAIESKAQSTAQQLQEALIEFGMQAKLLDPQTLSTPNGVLVNFAGHSTLTVKKTRTKDS